MKFDIGNDDTQDKPVKLKLESSGEDVVLTANDTPILFITHNGYILRNNLDSRVLKSMGFNVENGVVREWPQ